MFILQMAYSISISVNKNTNLAGGRSSPKAPKVRTFLRYKSRAAIFYIGSFEDIERENQL